MEWAVGITHLVNRKEGPKTTLWQGLFGSPVGTVNWSTLVQSRAQMGEIMGAIYMDSDFQAALVAGQDFISPTPTRDYLARYVAGANDSAEPSVGAVAEMTIATAKPGRLGEAMAWGSQITSTASSISGAGSSFFMDAYGKVGQMTWMAMFADLAACDAAHAKLDTSEEYLAEVMKAGDLFHAGSGDRSCAMRVA